MHEFYSHEGYLADRGDPLVPTTEAVVNEVIPQITEPTKNLFAQIHNTVAKGEYGVILQEGMSAKIPTFIIGRAIGDIYKQKGYEYPSITSKTPYWNSFQQDTHPVVSEINELLERREKGKRVLVITEYLANGSHLLNYKALSKLGIPYDVASIMSRKLHVAYTYNPNNPENSKVSEGTNVFIGQDNQLTPLISKRPQLHGRFSHDGSTANTRYKFTRVNPQIGDTDVRTVMQTVWSDARTLRHELVSDFLTRESLA